MDPLTTQGAPQPGEALSFSKRPLLPQPLIKRHSSINFLTPPNLNLDSTNFNEDIHLNHHKQQIQLQDSQVSKTTFDDWNEDDPMMDHNEWIRAPKFGRLQKECKAQIIGEMDDSFILSQGAGSISTPGTSAEIEGMKKDLEGDAEMQMHDENGSGPIKRAKRDVTTTKKIYQPANFAIKRSTSLTDYLVPLKSEEEQLISGRTLEDYNFEPFSNVNNYMLNNMEYTTTPPNIVNESSNSSSNSMTSLTSQTSNNGTMNQQHPKKGSAENLSKHKQLNLTPIRTIDGNPKTPNYKPCVLRLTSDLPQQPEIMHTANFLKQSDIFPESEQTSSTPTTAHWIRNSERINCFSCSNPFTLLSRRHHCRKCGEIFCMPCLSVEYGVMLNSGAQFDLSKGTVQPKCCSSCGEGWQRYLREKGILGNQTLRSTNQRTKIGHGKVGVRLQDQEEIDPLDTSKELRTVVPADWTWSSF